MNEEQTDDTPKSVSGPMLNQSKVFVPSTIGKLAGVDPQMILDRVADGELLRNIAKEYGCTRAAVSIFIAKHVDREIWQGVREVSIAARLERSCDEMELAEDHLTLARARESARLWMWRAEREHPHLYGAKPAVAIGVQGEGLQVNVVSYSNVAPHSVDNLEGSDSSTE